MTLINKCKTDTTITKLKSEINHFHLSDESG